MDLIYFILIYVIGVPIFVFVILVIRRPDIEDDELKKSYIFLLIFAYVFIIILKVFVY